MDDAHEGEDGKEISELKGTLDRVSPAQTALFDMEYIVHELAQRATKKTNVIIFNISEDDSDEAKVADILAFLNVAPQIDTNNLKSFTLSKTATGVKPRPLKQMNYVENSNNGRLDLIFCSKVLKCDLELSDMLLGAEDEHHPALAFSVACASVIEKRFKTGIMTDNNNTFSSPDEITNTSTSHFSPTLSNANITTNHPNNNTMAFDSFFLKEVSEEDVLQALRHEGKNGGWF
ncbi:hypothetical protein Trydic_g18100 [Trypoxylus dichotomus]